MESNFLKIWCGLMKGLIIGLMKGGIKGGRIKSKEFLSDLL